MSFEQLGKYLNIQEVSGKWTRAQEYSKVVNANLKVSSIEVIFVKWNVGIPKGACIFIAKANFLFLQVKSCLWRGIIIGKS